MKHFYKPGGGWKAECGVEYTVKAVEFRDYAKYNHAGWFTSLDDVISYVQNNEQTEGEDYESQLRDKIKSFGGKPAPRSSVETLEKQLAELEAKENGNDN